MRDPARGAGGHPRQRGRPDPVGQPAGDDLPGRPRRFRGRAPLDPAGLGRGRSTFLRSERRRPRRSHRRQRRRELGLARSGFVCLPERAEWAACGSGLAAAHEQGDERGLRGPQPGWLPGPGLLRVQQPGAAGLLRRSGGAGSGRSGPHPPGPGGWPSDLGTAPAAHRRPEQRRLAGPGRPRHRLGTQPDLVGRACRLQPRAAPASGGAACLLRAHGRSYRQRLSRPADRRAPAVAGRSARLLRVHLLERA